MEPSIQYARTSDGVNIAYAVQGTGPPLVYLPACWESIEWRVPTGTRFVDALAERHTVIQYERRGTGQSDRDAGDVSLETDLLDIDAVAGKVGFTNFALFGSFHLGPAAVAYAARYPDRISHLILYGTFANRQSLSTDQVRDSIISMVRSHWGMARRQLTDITAPGVEPEVLDWMVNVKRYDVSSDRVLQLLELLYGIDVRDLLAHVRAPTLVLHRRGDRAMPYRCALELAAGLPDARLVALDGQIHWPWLGDSDAVLRHILSFLAGTDVLVPAERGTPAAVATILFTDIVASTELGQRLGDATAHDIRRAHNEIVRHSLAACGGTEIKHTGDGIMASFGSASGALECAIAVQRAVAERNDENLRVHVGLNAGEPIAEERDLFGTSVDLARRICDEATGTEILVSDVVRQLAAGKAFTFEDRGERALKGIAEPQRLFAVRWHQ